MFNIFRTCYWKWLRNLLTPTCFWNMIWCISLPVCGGASQAQVSSTDVSHANHEIESIIQCPAGPDLVFEPTSFSGSIVCSQPYKFGSKKPNLLLNMTSSKVAISQVWEVLLCILLTIDNTFGVLIFGGSLHGATYLELLASRTNMLHGPQHSILSSGLVMMLANSNFIMEDCNLVWSS